MLSITKTVNLDDVFEIGRRLVGRTNSGRIVVQTAPDTTRSYDPAELLVTSSRVRVSKEDDPVVVITLSPIPDVCAHMPTDQRRDFFGDFDFETEFGEDFRAEYFDDDADDLVVGSTVTVVGR